MALQRAIDRRQARLPSSPERFLTPATKDLPLPLEVVHTLVPPKFPCLSRSTVLDLALSTWHRSVLERFAQLSHITSQQLEDHRRRVDDLELLESSIIFQSTLREIRSCFTFRGGSGGGWDSRGGGGGGRASGGDCGGRGGCCGGACQLFRGPGLWRGAGREAEAGGVQLPRAAAAVSATGVVNASNMVNVRLITLGSVKCGREKTN